jgi:hypothetical protein
MQERHFAHYRFQRGSDTGGEENTPEPEMESSCCPGHPYLGGGGTYSDDMQSWG